MTTASIVQKLWNYCNVLLNDGMSCGDYVEQLTHLLFLKMADERSRAPYNQKSSIPAGYDWPSLLNCDGDELFDHYRHTLEKLGAAKGLPPGDQPRICFWFCQRLHLAAAFNTACR